MDDSLYNPAIEKYGTDSYSWQYNTFGVQLDSRGSVMWNFEIKGLYKASYKFSFRPLYYVPVELWLAYVRPDALVFGDQGEQRYKLGTNYGALIEEVFDAWFGTTYTFELFKFNSEFTHDWSQAHVSLIDFYYQFPQKNFFATSKDYKFEADTMVYYEDPYWTFDILDFMSVTTPNIKSHALLQKYYGDNRVLQGQSLLGKTDQTYIPYSNFLNN